MNDHPIRIVAKPRKEVDLERLARVVIELARQQVKKEQAKAVPKPPEKPA